MINENVVEFLNKLTIKTSKKNNDSILWKNIEGRLKVMLTNGVSVEISKNFDQDYEETVYILVVDDGDSIFTTKLRESEREFNILNRLYSSASSNQMWNNKRLSDF